MRKVLFLSEAVMMVSVAAFVGIFFGEDIVESATHTAKRTKPGTVTDMLRERHYSQINSDSYYGF